jgi:hypothetical protein
MTAGATSLSRAHAYRALGWLAAELIERGLLPLDFDDTQLVDLYEEALGATVDPDTEAER